MLVQTVPCQATALDLRNRRPTVLALRQMQYENAFETHDHAYEIYKLVVSLRRRTGKRVDHMLIFYCTDCKKMTRVSALRSYIQQYQQSSRKLSERLRS
jgi:hypothetical protein